MAIIFFVYGLIFFVLGLSIAVYPKKHSTFNLARNFWLIAAFGMLQGIRAWISMFVLIYPQAGMNPLNIISYILMPLSFYVLLVFGVRTITEIKDSHLALRAAPLFLLLVWSGVAMVDRDFLDGEVFARYLLGFPGALLASVALLSKLKTFSRTPLQHIALHLKLAAGALFSFAIVAGLVVPDRGFFPASVINDSLFTNTAGVPVQFFRALCGLVLTYSILNILSVFDWETREAIRKSEERYKSLFNASLDGVFRVNADGVFTAMNPAGAGLFGYEHPEEIVGANALQFWRDPADRDVYRAELKVRKSVSSYPIPAQKRDGEPIELETSSVILEDEEGNFMGIEGILRDVTSRKRVEEEFRYLAVVDELTGLNNRRGFLILATQQIAVSDRLKQAAILIFADMNGMKRVNDTFGHKEGDRALISIANILKQTLRSSDIIARWGGDEFVCLALETSKDGGKVILEHLRESLDNHNSKNKTPYKLSISFGLTRYDPEHPCSIEELLERADGLMYEEKQRRKLLRV
jgi:diguanylate cyclase (GGDEF)-like protein/PAS domain S-box-containing protein